MRLWALFIVIVVGALAPPLAHSHDFRPLLIRISERPAGHYDIRWRDSPVLSVNEQPTLEFRGSGCIVGEAPATTADVKRLTVTCPASESSHSLVLRYPNDNPSLSTVIHLTRPDGSFTRRVGAPGESVIEIRSTQSETLRARAYLLIGFEHILGGFDHLLFLVALCLVTGGGWTIVRAVTGFTLGHSASLAASALGWASPPATLIESLIALSIVFVAAEAISRDRSTLTWRYPAIVSALFGLLHGFGFAGYLRDIGLPRGDELSALLLFNLGVEFGQIVFIGSLLLLGTIGAYGLARFLKAATHDRGFLTIGIARQMTAYGIGSMAAFWFLQRLVSI